MPIRVQAPALPRLTYLRIKNYRALRDGEFRDVLWGILKHGRYFLTGKRKTQWATDISQYLHLEVNKSTSFQAFRIGLASLR